MYRDNTEIMTTEQHNFVLSHGALGDMICSLPAIIHARLSHNEAMKMRVWVQAHQMALVEHLLRPYGKFTIMDFAEFPAKHADRKNWGEGAVSVNAPAFNTHTRNRVNMVDFAFNFLIDARPENDSQRSYPMLAPLGVREILQEYVVVPVGATSDNKLFRAKVMTPVLEWILEQGYAPVLVGTKVSGTQAVVEGKLEKLVIRDQADMVPKAIIEECLDFREKTTLLELRDILGHAEAVVGVDGGTLHLAGTTSANIIYAMGTTHPRHRFIARQGDPFHKIRYVIPRDLECAGCQSNFTLTSLDFRFCPYDDEPNLCMERLHPDDFIAGLKELGL